MERLRRNKTMQRKPPKTVKDEEYEDFKYMPDMKYDPYIHPRYAYDLGLLGLSGREIAEAFGISLRLLNLWKARHPAFRAAIHNAGRLADGAVAAGLYKRATGFYAKVQEVVYQKGIPKVVNMTKYYPPDVSAAKYWLGRRTLDLEQPWNETVNVQVSGEIEQHNRVSLLVETKLDDFSIEELRALKKFNLISEHAQNNNEEVEDAVEVEQQA